ncbi:HlyD family efflux transporter periplasmic adaptor subunit [Flavobacterium sp. 3HN19-14]|uniref:HlyD family efflux transporter periplasmic adaptor subunit n=1 Tax=Flavobacterium sp. 3HN19-14 TaxID=3448133 RepID=UPI003EE2FCF0
MAKDLIDIEHDYLDAKALYELNKKLFEQEILSANEWEKTQENFRFQKERKNIIQQSVQKEKEANKLQLSQIAQAQSAMRKSLGILRDNKNNFLVTAPVSGRVSSFEPILGKNYAAGESIGKIDVMKGYKLVADIDEFYLEKIIPGQKGTIEFQDKKITVVISKVIPEIKAGRFQVELSFGEKSPDLQQGISFSVRLQFSEKSTDPVNSERRILSGNCRQLDFCRRWQ